MSEREEWQTVDTINTRHLTECEGCGECDHLMNLYMACDGCGTWGNKEHGEWHLLPNGETHCCSCHESARLQQEKPHE